MRSFLVLLSGALVGCCACATASADYIYADGSGFSDRKHCVNGVSSGSLTSYCSNQGTQQSTQLSCSGIFNNTTCDNSVLDTQGSNGGCRNYAVTCTSDPYCQNRQSSTCDPQGTCQNHQPVSCVPEPSTLTLAILGLSVLGLRRRRQRRGETNAVRQDSC